MIDTHDGELGELGRLIADWANSQRFPPSRVQIAREVGVSKQQISNWMRGDFKHPLKPLDVEALARMMTPNGQDHRGLYSEVLEAMLRDTGHLPKAGRLGDRQAR